MITLLTVIRKKPEVSTEDFRRFRKHEYGPTYEALPQTRAYVQYPLTDLASDGAEDPIDAIAQISFESQEAMAEAPSTDAYKKAHDLREQYMRETSVGIHSARVDETVTFV
ncbi:EthD domain-containing protein [Kitasatospora sp. NBC_01287]|uniref:EthD domain-containing protein n=1 Tax=Kitasatospora sp. NBC_01287 TaxID=2903573 RepID=UPI00225B5169|nr:EthD domain-containing protein [Kitasatospora sp. NBC_01287]MCX4750110.1 EthD domain-containing protein [Kitasatospora sp. NBC_01287]